MCEEHPKQLGRQNMENSIRLGVTNDVEQLHEKRQVSTVLEKLIPDTKQPATTGYQQHQSETANCCH